MYYDAVQSYRPVKVTFSRPFLRSFVPASGFRKGRDIAPLSMGLSQMKPMSKGVAGLRVWEQENCTKGRDVTPLSIGVVSDNLHRCRSKERDVAPLPRRDVTDQIIPDIRLITFRADSISARALKNHLQSFKANGPPDVAPLSRNFGMYKTVGKRTWSWSTGEGT